MPLFASMFVIPFFYDLPIFIPLCCILLTFFDLKQEWKTTEVILLAFITAFTFLMFTHSFSKGVSLFGVLASIFIALNFKDRDYDFSLSLTFFFHILVVSSSFLSLYYFGYDYLPQLIYQESRHAVHFNEIVSYRVSGIYREPSNLGLSMLFLAMWGHQMKQTRFIRFQCLCFLAIAILTYSSVSLLALVYLVYFYRKALLSSETLRISIFLVPVLVIISIPVVSFFIDKFTLYQNQGLENATRFLILSSGLQLADNFSFIFGIVPSVLSDYVVYDLGPLISTLLVFGLCGLIPLIYFIKNAGFSIQLIILALTKVTLSNLLVWFVIFNRNRSEK